LELQVIARPQPACLEQIHLIRRSLMVLRRSLWPMREVVDQLCRTDDVLGPATRPYMRDVYDHTVQVMDIVETQREIASGLTDLYLSAVSNRMNEVMKVLTIMSTFFIPVTFLAGVYGMNFTYLPEKDWRWGYGLFWLVVLGTSIGLYVFFRRKGWLGR
jgi:magnesium transporter